MPNTECSPLLTESRIWLAVRLFALFGFFILGSCEQEVDDCGAKLVSSGAATASHHGGKNCMTCHRSAAGGRGCFVLAGTVYDSAGTSPVGGAVLRMQTAESGGTVVLTLTSDGEGNFYTTESVNFGEGLHPSIQVEGKVPCSMPYAVTIGACGACHGVTAGKVRMK